MGTSASVGANATGGLALGSGSSVTAANSIALGAGSVADRGPLTGYTAFGLSGTQDSAGELSVGVIGAPRQITNVAPGSSPTDAVNVAQLTSVAAQIGDVAGTAVLYDTAAQDQVTLAGADGTTISNVAEGTLSADSTDAVNGSQLYATNNRVDDNSSSITNLTTNIQNGAAGPVQYSDAATPDQANGGTPTNDLALVGAADAPVGLHNVADGDVSTGSTDAVNGGQLFDVSSGLDALAGLAVQYDDAGQTSVTLGTAGTPVAVRNVADGTLSADSTDAVNGSQLYATNNRVDDNSSSITNLTTNIQNGAAGPVQYSDAATPDQANGGTPTNDLALVGAADAPVGLHNVADGDVSAGSTDAVNGGQLFDVSSGLDALAGLAVQYDDAGQTSVTLGTAGTPVAVRNVAEGTLSADSTDAVNGSQLYATNNRVDDNSSSITNLTTNIQNGAAGPVQYSDAATPDEANGGTPTNDLALIGAADAPVGLHNVADGDVSAGSTDAVNGGQLFDVSSGLDALAGLAVQYDDAGQTSVTLGTAGTPVAVRNVAEGTLSADSTDAVNGSQLAGFGSSVATAIGGNTVYDASLNQLLTDIDFEGLSYSSIQEAVAAIDASISDGLDSPYFRVQSERGPATVSAQDSMAIGPEAEASAANSVALGSGAVANRGGQADYTALGLGTPQTSVGEVSVGTQGAERQITNLAAGSAATDAVNVAQLQGVADQVTAIDSSSVQYDDASHSTITLDGGTGGSTLTNVAAASLTEGSTDAVNGSQLYQTNVNVANNSSAISNLANSISNGGTGPVQYSNPSTPTVPNGGVRSNDVTLVGADDGSVALHNVGDGSISAGSTDAVNGGQVYELALTAVNAVSYDTDDDGNRTNSITLEGGNASEAVEIHNVADGTVAEGSTDAVNGNQLNETNQAVANAQSTANAAMSREQNAVHYVTSAHNEVALGGQDADNPVEVHNVAPGVAATDAVDVQQMNDGLASAIDTANSYTDARFAALDYDIKDVRRDNYAGTAGALATAGLPQAYIAGKGMIAIAGGTYGGESAVAFGFSKAMTDQHSVVKLSGSYDSRGRAGASAGFGYQF
nr:YadA-like family protein [Stakelama flava]